MTNVVANRHAGRLAIVTGAGSGLGKATAERLAAEGARVACVDIALASATSTADGIGDAAKALQCDVSDPASVTACVEHAVAWLGNINLAVTCAGIGTLAHSHELEFAEWKRILDVNLTGTFLIAQAAVKQMLVGGGGRIVTIASNAGLMGQPFSAAYCASKGGVVNLTRALADEYIKRGITVNCVAPGGIDTPLQGAFAQSLPEGTSWKDMRKSMTPLGNSQPEEVASVVAFIASDEARYMTGSIVSIDGGLTL